jgi:HK97 family phage major capsid protein
MNIYLQKTQEKYDAMAKVVESIQTRAAEEDRQLTADELATIKGQGELMRALAAEIEILAAEETRAAQVAQVMSNLRPGTPEPTHPGLPLGAQVKDRDPGHYRAVEEGGRHSFYGDMLRAQVLQDASAQQRLQEHNAFMRAQTTTDIAGVVPPKWISDLFTMMAQQDRALAANVASYTITDARPFSLPGQTANTTVANQPVGENNAIPAGDAYDAAAVVVTPSTVAGKEVVSRQLLDASTPAIDQLILADLTASYNAEIERRLGAAIRGIGTPIAANLSDFIDPTAPNFGYDLAVDAAMAVRKALFLRPTFFAMDYDTYGGYLKLKDADGRPIVVGSNAGPSNAGGVGSPVADGWIAGVPVVVSAGMEPVSPGDPGDYAAAMVHGPSVVLFESPQMSFRYEEKSGPESIELGLWRYAAIAVRQGTRAVKNILVDDDS